MRPLSWWLTPLLQCFDTVGWVIRPVKPVGRITYIVLVQTLNHAQSINHIHSVIRTIWSATVLGPILFLLYTADLIKRMMCPHLYADDTQICGFCASDRTLVFHERVSECINNVVTLMQVNCLQMNALKTQVLWCVFDHRQGKLQMCHLSSAPSEWVKE